MPETPERDLAPNPQRVVLVTGASGAGRSTALNVLEDIGFEAIDNLPLSLVPKLLDGNEVRPPLALGVHTRTRDFSARALADLIQQIWSASHIEADVLYLDCRPEVLLRRFSETRRRHPMAPAESPVEGVARDLDVLEPIRELATILIDTSDLTIHEFRAEMTARFAAGGEAPLALSLHSFSYKRGLPHGLEMAFDCRFLRNPYWDPSLRHLDGRNDEVVHYVGEDGRFGTFVEHIVTLADFVLPAHRDEGRSHISIGFGCTGGQHRSVAVAETVANRLAATEWQVSIRHRELERRAQIASAAASGSGA
ncbi:ATP-binding protein ManX [Rhodovulum sp. P5]|uniref:RNase adapter RapZ n=1 Tax=Rhodovulum sp. P5 TaxID=1564506 RepID=UPI0009C2FA22|nr:RNase adapter RapZ [Rhodovulum sp. P5]ARE41035.1 ATP-binding protein ManX [Rhodovulum sp. P5]